MVWKLSYEVDVMTPQEILLLDSTVTVQVGASQLQKIINTMKYYKEKAESAITTNEELFAEIKRLRSQIYLLENQTFKIRKIGEIDLGGLYEMG